MRNHEPPKKSKCMLSSIHGHLEAGLYDFSVDYVDYLHNLRAISVPGASFLPLVSSHKSWRSTIETVATTLTNLSRYATPFVALIAGVRVSVSLLPTTNRKESSKPRRSCFSRHCMTLNVSTDTFARSFHNPFFTIHPHARNYHDAPLRRRPAPSPRLCLCQDAGGP